jgi:hypothetical protein
MKIKMVLTGVALISLIATPTIADLITDYHPNSIPFWEVVDKNLKDKLYKEILDGANYQGLQAGKDSLGGWEAKMASGLALKGLGFNYAASRLLGEVVKNTLGTDIGQQALSGLEEISRTGLVDTDYVFGEIANDLEFENLQKPLADFIHYEQGLFDLLHGFEKWSDANLTKITPASYWDFKYKYYLALKEVSKDKMDSALEKFSSLVTNEVTPADIKNQATHQQARLIFEKGDYPQAYKIFKKVQLNPREKGLILLERAWAKYYEKDYGKALGLLVALEAPYFDPSRTPEPYILKMLMLKELCYYKSALAVTGEFNKHFNTSVQAIRKRSDLTKDQGLVNLAVLDQSLETWVNFLNQLKDERNELDKYNWENYIYLKNLRRSYDFEIDRVRAQLDWLLQDKIRKSADQLLDWQEQLTFLDYQTRLDSLRVIKPSNELPYKSEEISHVRFDRTYWENQGEVWFDELEDYKVFVKSQCEGNNSK